MHAGIATEHTTHGYANRWGVALSLAVGMRVHTINTPAHGQERGSPPAMPPPSPRGAAPGTGHSRHGQLGQHRAVRHLLHKLLRGTHVAEDVERDIKLWAPPHSSHSAWCSTTASRWWWLCLEGSVELRLAQHWRVLRDRRLRRWGRVGVAGTWSSCTSRRCNSRFLSSRTSGPSKLWEERTR